MKILKKDELFEIFKRKLQGIDPETKGSQELITETVEEYLDCLLMQGHIPVHFVESIQEDLAEEVIGMFRKKTYGFMDLKSYKTAQKSKQRPRST